LWVLFYRMLLDSSLVKTLSVFHVFSVYVSKMFWFFQAMSGHKLRYLTAVKIKAIMYRW
jgi:hypothetical protein